MLFELDEETKKRISALAKRSDSETDTGDIREWSDDDFSKAVPFHDIYKPKKEQITTRIDADVLMWLKSHGKGYQTLLNDLLRKEMMEELEAEKDLKQRDRTFYSAGKRNISRKQAIDTVHEPGEKDYNSGD